MEGYRNEMGISYLDKPNKKRFIDDHLAKYLSADKRYKSEFVRQTAALFDEHPKSILRRIRRAREGPKPTKHRITKPVTSRRKGRPRRLLPDELVVLETLAIEAGHPCGKRFKAMLGDWLTAYIELHGEVPVASQQKLLSLSAATLDRNLQALRKRCGIRGRSGTKPGSLLREQVPIRTDNWDITKPGFLEADTVAHCGNSLEGSFVWSLTMTDVHTGWTENRAVWNKGAIGVVDAVRNIEAALPFPVLAIDVDNGSEFLNHHLVNYLSEHKNKPKLTRSRPYKKNDNAHVEQKNWTHVRQLLGYQRLENPALVPMVNALYAGDVTLLNNLFMPQMKLIEKVRVGAKLSKRYDAPQTPLQRLESSGTVDAETIQRLKALKLSLNPIVLRRSIHEQTKAIYRAVSEAQKQHLKSYRLGNPHL